MKTNFNVLNKGGILFVLIIVFLSCNNNPSVEKNHHEHHDTIKPAIESKIDSAEVRFDELKQQVSDKLKQEMEETEQKIEELKAKKEKAETKVKNKIASEIEEQQARNEKLKTLWNKVKETTRDNWKNYEQEMKEIFKETKGENKPEEPKVGS